MVIRTIDFILSAVASLILFTTKKVLPLPVSILADILGEVFHIIAAIAF